MSDAKGGQALVVSRTVARRFHRCHAPGFGGSFEASNPGGGFDEHDRELRSIGCSSGRPLDRRSATGGHRIRGRKGREPRGAHRSRLPCPAGLRHRCPRLCGVHRGYGPRRSAGRAAWPGRRRRCSRARNGRRRDSSNGRSRADSRDDRRGDPKRVHGACRERRACRCPVVRHGRGYGGGLFRRDERDLPERARRRGGPRRCSAVLVLPFRGADDLLSGEARLRAGRHGDRGRRPAADPGNARRGDVHGRSRHRRDRPARHRRLLRARRGRRERPSLPGSLRRRQGDPLRCHSGDSSQEGGHRASSRRGDDGARARA